MYMYKPHDSYGTIWFYILLVKIGWSRQVPVYTYSPVTDLPLYKIVHDNCKTGWECTKCTCIKHMIIVKQAENVQNVHV